MHFFPLCDIDLMASLSLPSLTSVGTIVVYNSGALKKIDLPLLSTATDMTSDGGVRFWSNTVVTNISIPVLANVGYLTFDTLTALVNFPVLPRLQSVTSLTIRNCVTLTTIPELLFPNVNVISYVTLDTLVSLWDTNRHPSSIVFITLIYHRLCNEYYHSLS
jgi:hypothetical protein